MSKARHRHGYDPKTGKSFTKSDEKTVMNENFIKLLAQQAMVEQRFKYTNQGAYEVRICVYFEIPKSFSKKKRELIKQGELRPTRTPDWDNTGKLIGDALNGIVYNDDKEIADGHVSKFYSDVARVDVEITRLY